MSAEILPFPGFDGQRGIERQDRTGRFAVHVARDFFIDCGRTLQANTMPRVANALPLVWKHALPPDEPRLELVDIATGMIAGRGTLAFIAESLRDYGYVWRPGSSGLWDKAEGQPAAAPPRCGTGCHHADTG